MTFCIEYYADHIHKPGNEVYKQLKDSGVISFLKDNYDDLHGMSFTYLMQVIDEYTGNKLASASQKLMSHSTIRATLLPEIASLIAKDLNCTQEEALDKFYNSAVGELFCDDNTGLYGQSALYIASLFMENENLKNKGGNVHYT